MKTKFKRIIYKTVFYLLKKVFPLFYKISYFIIYYILRIRKKIVLKNLEIAFPNISNQEKENLRKKIYKNFIFYFLDMIKNINISKNELKNRVTIVNEDILKETLKTNKPLILMTAHFGNWEFAPKVIGAFYTPMVVVAREFENEKIGKLFKKSRNSFNISTIDKNGSVKEIVKAFKDKKAVAILIDQHSYDKSAIDVNFFNKKVKFNRSITTLSKKFNAIVLPMFSYRKNEKYYLEFLEPREFGKDDTIESFTQWQATTIENMIKKYPSEYYWFHKRFKNIKGIYD